jgi:hypothetical protein
MSGEELIKWAVAECEKGGYLPKDANILMFIRELRDVNHARFQKERKNEPIQTVS